MSSSQQKVFRRQYLVSSVVVGLVLLVLFVIFAQGSTRRRSHRVHAYNPEPRTVQGVPQLKSLEELLLVLAAKETRTNSSFEGFDGESAASLATSASRFEVYRRRFERLIDSRSGVEPEGGWTPELHRELYEAGRLALRVGEYDFAEGVAHWLSFEAVSPELDSLAVHLEALNAELRGRPGEALRSVETLRARPSLPEPLTEASVDAFRDRVLNSMRAEKRVQKLVSMSRWRRRDRHGSGR
ncbi:MAG: hypothetical protein AAF517_25945, partial [Planctomycetota bacterium]